MGPFEPGDEVTVKVTGKVAKGPFGSSRLHFSQPGRLDCLDSPVNADVEVDFLFADGAKVEIEHTPKPERLTEEKT
jgi:hypothetical protein